MKRIWVAPSIRGLGIAQRLLESLEKHAAAAGVNVLQMDTHRTLSEAQKLYIRNGYVEIAAYNKNPYAHHWFEKRGLQLLREHPLSEIIVLFLAHQQMVSSCWPPLSFLPPEPHPVHPPATHLPASTRVRSAHP
ncbi:GNAT family N-acetyltransferase [Alcaligenaceae bacterium]|nr:GNAT family N-acetyltransferase [Alcaligenaceae bacterium]